MAVPLFGPFQRNGNTFKPRYVYTPYSSIPVVSTVIALDGSVIDSWIVLLINSLCVYADSAMASVSHPSSGPTIETITGLIYTIALPPHFNKAGAAQSVH